MLAVESYERFFREEYAPLVGLGAWLTGDRAVGEELAQEALGIAHRRWAEVSRYDLPGAFVRRTVINLAANERRRRGRERRALRRLVSVTETLSSEPTMTPGTDLAPLWAEVAALPLHQRAAIGLRYLEGLSSAEIAETLGCSAATVRVHLHRGLRRLADRLHVTYDENDDPMLEERAE